MRKAHNVEIDNVIQSVDIEDGWIQELLEIDKDDLTLILGELANRASISSNSIKKARHALPSFSTAKWSEFAAQAGLPSNPKHLGLECFETPVYQLPPSFHEAVFERSWQAQDVYQEKVVQEAPVRMLDAYIVPILALFRGRIVDTPEKAMLETSYSTGGEVQHEIIMRAGVLFIVVELKLETLSGGNLAQLFLEFLSAAKSNQGVEFEGLRVHGLLTDLTQFQFYSYDPSTNKFCQDGEFIVDVTREKLSEGMIFVTNKIFGLVLFAFIEGLRAIVQKSQNDARGKQARWDLALQLALQCSLKFGENVTSLEDMERRSIEALSLLAQSVRSIPRFSAFTGTTDTLTSAQLKDLACLTVEGELRKLL